MHIAHLVVTRILGWRKALRVGPGVRLVQITRSPLLEGVVRSLLVVDAAELIEALLLGRAVGCRWAGCLGFEDAMHPLVAAVLLGMSGRNALEANSQLEPTHREPGQTGNRRRGGERAAIVRAHDLRQSVLPKRPFVRRPGSCSLSQAANFRGPQVGCLRRSSLTRSATSAGV